MSLPRLLHFDRHAWLMLHVYLALIFGFFFAILGLSGSLSIYREAIDRCFNPELVIEQPRAQVQSLDKIMLALRIEHPKRYGTWTLEMPMERDAMLTAWFEKPHETIDEFYAPLMVSINPYTAEVVANRFWGQTLTTWILDLHTQLAMGARGWQWVGVLGCLLTSSIVSGLYLWWPGWRQIWRVIVLKPQASLQQLLIDIHRLLGVLSAVFLLVLALTGVLLSFPAILTTLFGSEGMGHGGTGKEIVSTANPTKNPTTLSGAAFIARAPFPRAELRRVSTPAGDAGVYRINLRQGEEVNHRHPFTTVWVDRWSGQIKEVRDPKGFSFGATLSTWVWPIHTGEALGAQGRLVWFLCGQALFWLYITGLSRWLMRQGWVPDSKDVMTAGRQSLQRFTRVARQLSVHVGQKLASHWPSLRDFCRLIVQRVLDLLRSFQK